jgi:hypothetical protein
LPNSKFLVVLLIHTDRCLLLPWFSRTRQPSANKEAEPCRWRPLLLFHCIKAWPTPDQPPQSAFQDPSAGLCE